ncbi:MAG: peptidoglycan DD-metalloendopeptidase family protein [Clostridiales bacterium]|nr:peptidoglycan DD-metalloendopeptidase family protein [Clostridiales bacterium]
MMRIDLYKIKRKGMQVAVVTTGALLMSFASIFATPGFSVHAEDSKEDVEQQKEEAQQGQAEAKANAAKYQKKVDKLTAAVNELDKQATDISTQIVQKKQEAEDLQTEIDETQTKLAEAQVSEDNQYEAMKKRIQYLYEEGDVEYIDALLSSASFEDSLNKSEYVDQISSYDQKQLDKLVKTKNDIAEYEQTLKDDLADVEKVKADLEQKQSDLDDVISQKNAEINKYSDDVAMQQALAEEYARQESELDDKLAEIARQEQQRLEEERKQQEAEQQQQQQDNNGGSSDDNGGGSGDNGGGSSTGTGQFIWPVSGPITDYFGPRESPTAGASTNHMGIDIGCSYGVPIAAADSGVVTVAEWGESGGNYVMIDHGNGFVTMYLHNSSLAVSVGDVVSQGQTIAYAGSTGYSTGVHCHFSVFLNGSYVNPLDYL